MMEISQTVNLYITYVEKEGPFLKVWGQTEKNNSIYVEQFLLGASPQFDGGIGNISIENLQPGTLVCARFKDNKYYRARITNATFLGEGFVEVSFIDYGNKDIVPCGNIRNLQNFPTSFISIPPLATSFIFAEAHCPGGGEWNDTILDSISKEIKYREVQCTLITQATQYYLVKLYIGGNDLCSLLINRGLMQPISLQAQQAVLLSMSMQRSNLPPPQSAPLAATGINTYKACTLEPGCQYPVYVSYVNDGPCHFSVQLKQSEEVLVMLMNDINTITLRLLEDVPIPGTICLARCQEDGNICRAVVTNEVDNQFKVFYVDFGNYEVVPLDSLYQIPFKYVIPKVMAIRFSLAGVEKSTVTIEMQCAFKQFVDNRLLYMKVLPTATRMAIPKCELWDPETKTSALDVVNRAAQNAYPEPVSLNRGFSQLVKVSYVYSCNRFFVQLASKENELLKLMLDLQAACQTNEAMDASNIKVGLPCCALFESDQQWYRSQVVEVLGSNVKVRYIDYGNEEIVPFSQLKIIDGEQLTVLRPQAIECCLNGYQNMEEDLERDGFLEELILERQFTMKVAEMTNKKALVELFDESNYNIASLLLDKLATAKSQVSPCLVQAGNKIEHRKSFPNQNGSREQNFRQDRKPGRTNDRNESTWRQEKKDFRDNERNSNDNNNERNSWRQNNKGFSPNSEKFSRDKNRSRNDWHNKENVNTDNWEADNNKSPGNDNWSTPQNTNFQNNSRENDFNRNRGSRFNKDDWNSGGQRTGGFKKRNDFRKDGSDSSGSETSFQRGPRTSSRADRPNFQKRMDKPRNASFGNNTGTEDSWNVSAVTTIDAAPATATFVPYEVVGTVSNVIISWFHSPSHFFVQLADIQDEFKHLMTEIQQFYKGRQPESAVVGAPVIGLFPEDNVLYRAQVLEVTGRQYKLYYVDFGNVSNVAKVWPIEKKFMNLPAQAIVCSLNEIAPPGDQWPDPDNYSKYFDKSNYVCRFVNKDEEKTYVDIFYNDEDIKQLLIQDNLAISTEKIIPDIEIPLLLGQQFRAILMSINNLNDIIIALECGLAISCKMHNLEEAVTTDDTILKRFLENTVIIYVDNVIDDKLEITLYDTEGSKIEVITPDEGACDMVELPCPILILRSTLTGSVSHADDTSVFIQPTEYLDTITYLLDQMYESYEEMTQDGTIIPEVELLYAVKSEDGNWYRAKVTNITDTQASVVYIDYGNCEDVDFNHLRQLSDKFLEICVLCVQVFVTVPTDSFIEKDVVANIYYGENGWEGTIECLPEPSAESATPGDSGCVEGSAEDQGTEENIEVNQQSDAPLENGTETFVPEASTLIEETDAVQNGIQVVVSHIDSPTEFYLQLFDSLGAINELQDSLQEQTPDMPVLETPTAGVLCAAPYSVDQQWYRAEVLDADDDITTVRFVDYGNTDVINNESTKIKTLPPNLLSLAVYATRSSLKIRPVEGEWSTNAFEKFETLLKDGNVTAEFIGQDEKTNYVELYVNGENIKDSLINDNLAVPIELSEDGKSTCFVSHLNSPSEFWIQLENCVDELEWIAEQLSGAENFPELEDTTPGTLCAALFPDDQMWYRARILSDTVAGLELLFIDYGNSSISSSLRQLPEDLVVTPPLAQKCSLQKPDAIPYWTPQAVEKFNEISADGQTIFTVHKISTGETAVVQLLVDGQDVTSMLLPETEEGYVKNVENLDSFNVEKDGEILPDKYKLEPIPGMTWTEESNDKFKELNDQGAKLFQIEFLAENTVRLYVDGSDIRPNLKGIKTSILNMSRTSTDENQTENEAEGTTYLNDYICDESQKEVVNTEFLQSSTEDMKEILGLTNSNDVTVPNDTTEVHILDEGSENNKNQDINLIDEEPKPEPDHRSDDVQQDHLNVLENQTTQDVSEKPEHKSDVVSAGGNTEQDYFDNKTNQASEDISENIDAVSSEHGAEPVNDAENKVNQYALEKTDHSSDTLEQDHLDVVENKTTQDVSVKPEHKSDVVSAGGNMEQDYLDNKTNQASEDISEKTDAVSSEHGAEPVNDAENKVNQDAPEKTDHSSDTLEQDHLDVVENKTTQDVSVKPEHKSDVVSAGGNMEQDYLDNKTNQASEDISEKTDAVSSEHGAEPVNDAENKVNQDAPEKTDHSSETLEQETMDMDKKANQIDSQGICQEPNLLSKISNIGDVLSENLAEAEIATILKDAVDKALSKKDTENQSRPTSRSSGRISHDDRILPAVVSRPHSPVKDEEQERSRPPSACSGKASHNE